MLIASYPLLVACMVALFSVHTLLLAYHIIAIHSRVIRLTNPTLCSVCMHMQCLLCTKMLKMDSVLNVVMLHYLYARSNYCKQETNSKNSNKISKNNLKRKVGGRYSTAKIGFFGTVFSSNPPCFFTQPRDHTPMKSPR